MTGRLEVRLLGPFEVVVAGKPVEVPGAKRQALVACLALRTGRVVSTDTLVEALWGSDLPAAPRNAVQHHVARLRRALGDDAIRLAADGYALDEAMVDAIQFEELLAAARGALRAGDARGAADTIADALALWRGPALLGLPQSSWATAEAARLDSLRLDALEERFEAALALGEHGDVGAAIRAALEESPFRERLWGQLMLTLYRSGRQADALEVFQEARRVLLEQLALEPGPELRRLQEAILAHDPAIAPVPAAPRRRGNLPASSTSFVDREAELAQVVELVREHRLVTLTGPPGVGKSRLALEAARALASELRGGAWHVGLANAASAADVVRLVAQSLDVRGADPLARTVARLRDTDAILVFDACEHVLEESARVVSAVLAECPDVRVLATSREVLHVVGEVRVIVDPLGLPDAGASDAAAPAVELFTARARAARPGFELTDEDAWLAAEISRLVDGLPLAIELAAARVNVLGLAELLALVRRRLELLHDRPTSDASRAALGTLVEWSYDLLHADEKTLLHHVAVHRGGAPLPALVAAGAEHGLDEMTVIQLLGTLVDKSIVTVSFPSADARYDLLDTVRDYALERLAEGGGLAAARKAHAEYFATLADAAHGALRGPEWRAWVGRLELEHDNLWAALTYAHEAPDAGIAGRLGALAWYFALAERVSEGRRFVELALASASEDAPAALRLELLAFLCYFATEELDLDAAIEAGERALAATEPRPPQSALVEAALSLALAESGDGERAVVLAEGRTLASRRAETTGASPRPASCGPRLPLSPETCPQSPPWRRRPTVTPRRSGSTRSRSPRCCSRRGSPSGGATRAPQRRRISARSRSRAAQGSPTTLPSRWPDSAGPRSRAETCARPKSSSAGRSPPRRRHGRRGPRRTRASGWPASWPPPETPTPPRRCTATCSSGPTSRGRTELARACSSRSRKTRRGRPGRPRRPRAAPRDCGRVGRRRDRTDAVAPRRRGSAPSPATASGSEGVVPWQGVGSRPRDACRGVNPTTTGGTRGDEDD